MKDRTVWITIILINLKQHLNLSTQQPKFGKIMETKWMCPFLVRECLINKKGFSGHPKMDYIIHLEVIITQRGLHLWVVIKDLKMKELSFSCFRPAATNQESVSWDTDLILQQDFGKMLVRIPVKPICPILNLQLKLVFRVAIISVRSTRENKDFNDNIPDLKHDPFK